MFPNIEQVSRSAASARRAAKGKKSARKLESCQWARAVCRLLAVNLIQDHGQLAAGHKANWPDAPQANRLSWGAAEELNTRGWINLVRSPARSFCQTAASLSACLSGWPARQLGHLLAGRTETADALWPTIELIQKAPAPDPCASGARSCEANICCHLSLSLSSQQAGKWGLVCECVVFAQRSQARGFNARGRPVQFGHSLVHSRPPLVDLGAVKYNCDRGAARGQRAAASRSIKAPPSSKRASDRLAGWLAGRPKSKVGAHVCANQFASANFRPKRARAKGRAALIAAGGVEESAWRTGPARGE